MSPNHTAKSKRIARNTLLLYLRMLFMMLIGLYTSRVTLAALGVEDYGIYNVVGGFVGLFSMISGSLSVAISRFLTFELGKRNTEHLNTVFCTSVSIQILMAVIILLVAEILGVWFLNYHLNIPADRLYAANWVFQCCIISFLIGLISVPYNALIVAHEKMSAFAYISILDALLKLGIVFLLTITPVDGLILYSILLMAVAITIRIVYGAYCHRHFSESHFCFILDKKLLRSMFSFISWAFIGNGVVVLKEQGTNVLLNLFCGPIVNAASGIAMQVNSVAYGFVSNFMVAVSPQITKSYAEGDLSYMHKLIIRSGKYSFYILILLFFPLYANINFVLNFWLVEVPEHTASFVILILLYSLLDCFGNPLVTGVLAEGAIKRYEINLAILYLSNFGLAYSLLDAGYQPEYVFVLNVLIKVFVIGALVLQAQQKIKFPVLAFMSQSILRSGMVFAVCYIAVEYALPLEAETFFEFIYSSAIILCIVATVICCLGLNQQESQQLIAVIKTKLSNLNNKPPINP